MFELAPTRTSAHRRRLLPTRNHSLAKHNRKPSQITKNNHQRPKSISSFCRVFCNYQGQDVHFRDAALDATNSEAGPQPRLPTCGRQANATTDKPQVAVQASRDEPPSEGLAEDDGIVTMGIGWLIVAGSHPDYRDEAPQAGNQTNGCTHALRKNLGCPRGAGRAGAAYLNLH